MKKSFRIITVLMLIAFAPSKINAQAYNEKQSVVTVGYGFPNLYKNILKVSLQNSYYGYTDVNLTTKVTGFGPFFIKYEYALTKLIGVGASVGYWSTKFTQSYHYQSSVYNPNSGNYYTANYTDVMDYKVSSLSAGARLNFHFGTQEKLDPYAGIAAGYTNTVYRLTQTSDNPDYISYPAYTGRGIPVYFAITAGLRYYFTKNIGAYAELGLDKWSVIQGGLAIKF